MRTKDIHTLVLSSKDYYEEVQNELSNGISLVNNFMKDEIELCAGVDLAYWEKDGEQYGVCSIIVLDYRTKIVVEKVYSYGKINVQYAAGFLAFRELPLIVEAVHKLSSEPDIFLFDGNGYLHFNHMGIATHASFFLDKPTIGVAKSYLKIKGNDYDMPINEEGAYTNIVIDNDIYGRALRTRLNIKPIFVSCGNYIDIETTTEIVRELTDPKESRLPIPVRLADLETHKLRSELRNHFL